MKSKLPILTLAIALLLAGCSSTHTLTQNFSKEDEIVAKRNKELQRDFIYNLILLARCNPQLLDDYAYTYDINSSYFYALYFTPFKWYNTPGKTYLSYDPSYVSRYSRLNEYVSQYANPYTPAPAGFQKNALTKISSFGDNKYQQSDLPVRSHSNPSNATAVRLTSTYTPVNNNSNYSSGQNNVTNNRTSNAIENKRKFESENQPVKTYTPSYTADNNNQNNINNNQSAVSAPNNSQVNKQISKNMPPL